MNDTDSRFRFVRYAGNLVAILVIVAVVVWYFCWGTQTTVLLVRHADRHPTADALTPTGTARAQELAHVLEKSGITAIYTSQANRTQQTAAPTADLLGITPVTMTATDVSGLVSTIHSNNSGQTVLVVGHSNTVPQIITEFGGPAVTIGEDEFDNLFLLTLCRCRWRTVSLTKMQYGAPSP